MTTDNDFVAEKLAIQDWKPNQRCNEHWRCGLTVDDAAFYEPHDIPAPDLLANPWLLVAALWRRHQYIEIYHDNIHLWGGKGDKVYRGQLIDGNLPAALLQAAADMLRKESK